MPSREKEKNISFKYNIYNYSNIPLRKQRKNRAFRSQFTARTSKQLNDMIFDNESMIMKNKESWKVVPKDSCEVYKDRRKRRMDAQRKVEEEEKEEGSDQEKIVKQAEDKKKDRKSPKRVKINQKRNRRSNSIESRSSNTSMSSCSCSICMGSE